MKKKIILPAVAVLLLAAATAVWFTVRPPATVFQGQMEARETDIAPKLTGRIAEILVKEGDVIEAGALLLRIDSPEARAKLEQASGAREAADAVAAKAAHGARPEEVEMARMNWQRAQAAAELAEKSYQRVAGLAAEGLIAEQKRDEAETNFKAARDAERAAQAQYRMAQAGARAEDQAAARGQARQVAGVVAEAEAARAETELRSPVGGQVVKVLARVGELSPAGVAVVTVVDPRDQWVVINVREDALQRFAEGAEFDAVLPALGEQPQRFKVYFRGVLPDFATWRATRGGQGFDARTFEVRARPLTPLPGARPGMSVLLR